ncbi:uncharacterized protein [Dermacentor andersoni]|uniref:uncharacterized protein n=1 Tax=Dermacentor andersoni TaxID=34620 RepID=UPI0024180960|nr:uncharacterized protein LOC126534061 isoform X4 [Dermacentor andersoni]
MTCEKIFAAVLISIIFTDLKSQVRYSSPTYRIPWDIMQFVSRMQPIWTYNTTERTGKTCKVDVVRYIGTAFMEFNRSFDYHGHRHDMTAVISRRPYFLPVLSHGYGYRLKRKKKHTHDTREDVVRCMQPTSKERIIYMSRDCTCALILVTSFVMNLHHHRKTIFRPPSDEFLR